MEKLWFFSLLVLMRFKNKYGRKFYNFFFINKYDRKKMYFFYVIRFSNRIKIKKKIVLFMKFILI